MRADQVERVSAACRTSCLTPLARLAASRAMARARGLPKREQAARRHARRTGVVGFRRALGLPDPALAPHGRRIASEFTSTPAT